MVITTPRLRDALLLMALGAGSALGQGIGGIRGVIFDKEFDVPLGAARVFIAETSTETLSREDGSYVFNEVEPGVYTLVFSKDGYTRQVNSGVVVAAGRLTEVDASLTGDFTDMEEFIVQEVSLGAGAEIALLELRATSPALIDSVSSQLMSQAGASDAASALTLVSGATVEDGKYPVIRGLPDRYVNSQLNGIRLPTADAEKRAVELDQFPSSAIDSIQVSKTFTPDQQGDASGGAVNIVLKGIPDERIIKLDTSTSFNTQTSFNDDFLSYDDSNLDYWGRDKDRGIDEESLGGNIDGSVGVNRRSAPVDYKWAIAVGDKQELDNEWKLGGFASFFYERDSSYFDGGIDDKYWVEEPGAAPTPQFSQGSPTDGDFKTSLFNISEASREVKWGALGVIGLENDVHSLTLTGLYTRSAVDTATLAEDTRGKAFFYPGYDPNDPSTPGHDERQGAPYLRLETLSYTERETKTLQLAGRHTLPDPELYIDGFFELLPPEIDWSVSNSVASFYQPDKRQFGSVWLPARENPGAPPFVDPFTEPEVHLPFKPAANFTLGNLQRITKSIEEESDQYAINLKLPFEQWSGDEGYFKFGIFNDETNRSYEQETYSNFNDNSASYNAPFEDFWSAEFPDEDHPVTEALVDVDYRGQQKIEAAYWMVDVPLTSFFNVIGGTRYESTELSIVNTPEEEVTWIPPNEQVLTDLSPGDADVDFQQRDILPMIGFKFQPLDQVTLRGSYSETVARQTFRELSPILQQEFLGGDIFIGNPNLQMSAVKNYDLRLDYTPFEGSLLSASVFRKEIENPIEYVQKVVGFVYTTPVNYPEGELSGIELELRQDMGRLWSVLEELTIGANATFIESEVTIPEEEQALFADATVQAPMKTRDMTNAPEYLYNLFFIYRFAKLGLPGTSLGVFYTVRGDTLVAGAGVSKNNFVPSVYETEYGSLNATLTQKLGRGFELKLQGKNLLDPEIETVYRSEYIGADVTKTSYKKGREFSIGLGATF